MHTYDGTHVAFLKILGKNNEEYSPHGIVYPHKPHKYAKTVVLYIEKHHETSSCTREVHIFVAQLTITYFYNSPPFPIR